MVVIPGWTPEVERSFKQVLFRFLEDIHCTKAALYLLAEDGSYALLTQYGFGRRDELAAEFHADDQLVVKTHELRACAAAFNGPEELEGVASYLEGAGTRRLLLAPIYGASRVLGFAEARDKGRKQPFTESDVAAAQAIARALLDTVARFRIYPELELEAAPAEESPIRVQGGESAGTEGGLDEVGLEHVLEAAGSLGDRPEVAGVAVTVVDGGSAGTVMWLPRASAEVDRVAVLRHQADALRVERLLVPDSAMWSVELQALAEGAAPAAAQVVASAVLLRAGAWALVGSVLGEAGSAAAADGVARLQERAKGCRESSHLRYVRRRLARSLLDGGGPRIPELTEHSEAVSRLAWFLARAIGRDRELAVEAAVVGLVHDVGMRELGGQELYRRSTVGGEERRRYQEHVVAGERLIRAAGLDSVASAVRHHHERWDGTGYPDRLAGESIPLVSRVVHVAEVFDVLTSDSSYRRTLSTGQALSVIRASSGRQFDPAVVEGLGRVVE